MRASRHMHTRDVRARTPAHSSMNMRPFTQAGAGCLRGLARRRPRRPATGRGGHPPTLDRDRRASTIRDRACPAAAWRAMRVVVATRTAPGFLGVCTAWPMRNEAKSVSTIPLTCLSVRSHSTRSLSSDSLGIPPSRSLLFSLRRLFSSLRLPLPPILVEVIRMLPRSLVFPSGPCARMTGTSRVV